MTPARFNRVVRRQLNQLLREGLLGEEQHRQIAARYVTAGWDWTSLGKWLLVFGALSAAAGGAILAREVFGFTLRELAAGLLVLTIALLVAGRRLRQRPWTSRSCELLGGCSLIGLTVTLGALLNNGSDNWPALVLIDLAILLALSYLLRNILLLVLSAVLFFVWFGGVTGYASGWGAYWFGMNYPLRFLLAGAAIALVALVHRRAPRDWLARYPGFFYVWLASGLFFAEMAMWLLSLFGNFGSLDDHYAASGAELLLFNLLWAGSNAALLWLGARFAVRMLRGFAVTFLIIQGYTLYFTYVAGALDIILASALAGSAALLIVLTLEKRRRLQSAE